MRPYRYDIVGSFLRPDYLKDARAEYAEGTLRVTFGDENTKEDVEYLVENLTRIVKDIRNEYI